jgi:hypothetical protein
MYKSRKFIHKNLRERILFFPGKEKKTKQDGISIRGVG